MIDTIQFSDLLEFTKCKVRYFYVFIDYLIGFFLNIFFFSFLFIQTWLPLQIHKLYRFTFKSFNLLIYLVANILATKLIIFGNIPLSYVSYLNLIKRNHPNMLKWINFLQVIIDLILISFNYCIDTLSIRIFLFQMCEAQTISLALDLRL